LRPFTALVLAGSRGGPDPVAGYAGVSHKALIELAGRSLLRRVVEALDAAGATRICVSSNDPDVAAELATIRVSATLETIAAADGPSLSVRQAADRLGAPLLVTTADHALLEPQWVRQFIDAIPDGADIAALLAPEALVQAAAPGARRTYLRFRDGRFSGCNLFWLATPRALAAIDLWRRVEAHRKEPWRIAGLLGPSILLRYALNRLTLDGAVAAIGRKAGVTAAAVRSPYGLAAVDVDKPADLDLVRSLVSPP
jgi:GTP:adenosylcobinamide-phosphate guanylyltransferase